ncbi:golgin subfamily A member 5-like isoform X3 [Rhodnius prolixus]|uniref:golgin subfamily A member 5-like isoform X3 n=1 Tax=Rhodnius prolixus TaxID=13249 RepID=UPI003D18BCD3
MSWISDIAGRAEDLLNKIDHNAAAVLKKEKKKKHINQDKLHIESSDSHLSTNICTPRGSPLSTPKLTPKHSQLPDKVLQSNSIGAEDEDKLMQYLNNSSYDIESLENRINNGNLAQQQHPTNNGATVICLPDEAGNGTARLRPQSTKDSGLETENEMLKNEVRSLNTEVSLLLGRAKNAEKEMAQIKSRLSKKESDAANIEKELNSVKHRLLKCEEENNELISENQRLKKMNKTKEIDERSLLKETEVKLSQCQLDAQHREESLKGDIAALRIRVSELEESLCESRKQHAAELSELGSRLSEARTELSEYMAKATSRLALKEKVVEELRLASNQESLSVDVLHLKSEVEWLTEECERLRGKSEAARLEAETAEKRLEDIREECAANLASLQARLAQEHARRMAAEENCTLHTQELQSVREELTRQVMSMTERVRERESELTRLRRQLAQRGINNPSTTNQDQRVTALTKALVEKELALEQVKDQRNQLRIQLDRIKSDYGNCTYPSSSRSVSVNDTDDAKAQVPLFMSEGPHDTMVTRRVKRAYTCVDSLGMKTGRFLRRYPLARLLVFVYVTLPI